MLFRSGAQVAHTREQALALAGPDAAVIGGAEVIALFEPFATRFELTEIDADYRGEEMTIAFNPAYLMEGVEAVSGDEVIIEVSDPSKAALLHGVDETKFRYLLMPVRVQ